MIIAAVYDVGTISSI